MKKELTQLTLTKYTEHSTTLDVTLLTDRMDD